LRKVSKLENNCCGRALSLNLAEHLLSISCRPGSDFSRSGGMGDRRAEEKRKVVFRSNFI
jgi:hypothetical protein